MATLAANRPSTSHTEPATFTDTVTDGPMNPGTQYKLTRQFLFSVFLRPTVISLSVSQLFNHFSAIQYHSTA